MERQPKFPQTGSDYRDLAFTFRAQNLPSTPMKQVVRAGAFFGVVMAFTVAAAACGGSLATIPDEDAGTSGTSTPTGTATPTGTGTSTPPSTGTTTPVPPPTSRDGGQPPQTDASATDASSPNTLACGAATCTLPGEECCITQAGASCIAKGATCQGGTLSCTSKANCTGNNVCCGRFGGGGGSATCAPSCGGGGPGGGAIQLCATSAECTGGTRCMDSFGGLRICR
jgi:hypothetical protein